MKWIVSQDLRTWANKRDCQETLPHLIRKLIRATSSSISNIKFPAGDNVLIGGWDGILEVSEGTEYIPKGKSVWEFGANRDTKGKADGDFIKRTNNPLGVNKKDTTYVFVTPRLWQKGEDWAKEQRDKKDWKDVKVINAELLEEWIEVAPTVGAWLSKHIGKYPTGGIQPTDDFWEEWSIGEKYSLVPNILLSGRKKEQEQLLGILKKNSSVCIQSISREESLAFIIAAFKGVLNLEEDFFARSIIVDNRDAFRELSTSNNPLILIPRFDDNGVINRAIQKGHTVIIPMGADASNNWGEKITLPRIEREGFISALEEMGISTEFAEKYSRESARNIGVLRRQLHFIRSRPTWATKEFVSEIIPALIVGRWEEDCEDDKRIISEIAGEAYENYSRKLKRWVLAPDAPIIKIGNTWRLISPFDAWINASENLTRSDFNLLQKAALEILTEVNPVFDLETNQRYMATLLGKSRKFSGSIREGITQSLILTSLLGNQLNFDLSEEPSRWVDNIVAEILKDKNPLAWKSFGSKLTLLAEASPLAFMDALERHLKENESVIASLFVEEQGLIMPNSHHSDLLWALEILAWFPDYLSRVSLIFAKIASIDLGGTLSNRPINSLNQIFKVWFYQTLATFEERMNILKLMIKKEFDITWNLLIGLLPHGLENSMGSAKPRWRLFNVGTQLNYTHEEVYKSYSTIIEILISNFDNTESKLVNLIDASRDIPDTKRSEILQFAKQVYSIVDKKGALVWNAIRQILGSHNSHPTAKWVLPKREIEKYEDLFKIYEPEDDLLKCSWLFEGYWPTFPEGFIYGSITDKERFQQVNDRRKKEVKNLYLKFGVKKIIETCKLVKQPQILGDVSAYLIDKQEEILLICELLKGEKEELNFAYGFIFRKFVQNEISWIFDLFNMLKQKGFSGEVLAGVFLPLPSAKLQWEFIDSQQDNRLQKSYWLKVNPNFHQLSTEDRIIGLNYLIEHNRYFSSIHVCSTFIDDITSEMAANILKLAAIEESDEVPDSMTSYYIEKIFNELYERDDLDLNTFANLEWQYISVSTSRRNRTKPKKIHQEFSKNPSFFIDIVKWSSKPDNEELFKKETEGMTNKQLTNRAIQAYRLLNSWKDIPGVDLKGNIDAVTLSEWVKTVRDLASQCYRQSSVDVKIGEKLALYPEDGKSWPPNEICEIIENINTEDIKSGFYTGIFNKRSVTSKGVYDGGDIERNRSLYFQKLASTHRNQFPEVAKVLDRLVQHYDSKAKREDEDSERRKLEH